MVRNAQNLRIGHAFHGDSLRGGAGLVQIEEGSHIQDKIRDGSEQHGQKQKKKIHKMNANRAIRIATENTFTLRPEILHTYILLSEFISRRITFQLQEYILQELISRKLHITYSFVIQRITWKGCLGIMFSKYVIT